MGKRLVISLIGMSNVGKTYWSKRFEREGFRRYWCDRLIEDKLNLELKKLGLAGGIQDIAKWIGQPFDPQYPRTSKKYLDFEGEVINEVLERIGQSKANRVVIDTTGSVIYLGETILNKLSAMTKVIYLETSDAVKEKMYRLYHTNPKPVIWGASFMKADGETNTETLSRCYPGLLAYRASEYAKIADITLSFDILHSPEFTIDKFIQLIAND